MSDEQEFLTRLAEIVGRRETTDRRMGNGWMLIPILPIIVVILVAAAFVRAIVEMLPNLQSLQGSTPPASLGASLGTLIVGAYALAIVAGLGVLFLLSAALYYLLKRRNEHFRRQQLLYRTLAKYLGMRESAGSKSLHFAQLCEDAEYEEHERPAGVWAILNLFAAPIVSLLLAFNLTQDLSRHEAMQTNLQESLPAACAENGIVFPSLANTGPKKRDPMLFLLLTIITAGLFWIYWFHTLLSDYNEHFANQAAFEDRTLGALTPTTPGRKCAGCGGLVPSSAKYCPFCGKAQTN